VQNKRVHICAKLGDHKRHTVSHQAADEVNVTRQSVEFGYAY